MLVPSVYQLKNFYWPDGSLFCFDLSPKDVTLGWYSEVSGGTYDVPRVADIPFYPVDGAYAGWSCWLDKFQKDYRFCALSDENASANLFPEVDDPWMFTEYMYQGTGRKSLTDPASSAHAIVEPPLVAPHKVVRAFDGEGSITASDIVYLNDSPTTRIHPERRVAYTIEHRWRSRNTKEAQKLYWENELDAMNWQETLSDESTNRQFERTDESRRQVSFVHPSNNAGVALNRVSLWAQSTRWGQSQNIPMRVVNLTAPPDYIVASERLTGKIVPHITLRQGQPVYDNAPSVGGQGAVYYDRCEQGKWNWGGGQSIGLTAVKPEGVDGVPESLFTYPLPANNDKASLVPLPKKPQYVLTEPQYVWREITRQAGDLIHRGCTFWTGHKHDATTCQAFCRYAQNNLADLVRSTEVRSYANADTSTHQLSKPVSVLDEELEVMFGGSASGSWQTASASLKTITWTAAKGQITSFTVVSAGSSGTTSYMRLRILRKDHPIPHKSLCAFYGEEADDKTAAYQSQCKTQDVRPCPFYRAQGPRILATYEAKASNGAEWANLQRGLPPGSKKSPIETAYGQSMFDMGNAAGAGGFGVTATMAYSFIGAAQSPDPYTEGLPKDFRMTPEITFEPEKVPIDGKQCYYDTPNGKPPYQDPTSKLKIKRGTGFHLLDTQSNASFGGVDSVFFGFINQINYRVMHSVQHCYRSDKCDAIMKSPPHNATLGWRRGSYS
ncbi:MAG: hypothetical protein FWD53_13555, partial [Phycisphaerales bacterium]|nr:hypothetical protein [Phycisphaerales bacterium]